MIIPSIPSVLAQIENGWNSQMNENPSRYERVSKPLTLTSAKSYIGIMLLNFDCKACNGLQLTHYIAHSIQNRQLPQQTIGGVPAATPMLASAGRTAGTPQNICWVQLFC